MNDGARSLEPRFEIRPSAEAHFAWCRTRLSLERTLMSWVRTAAALIGFGFTIVQFFERFAAMANVKAALRPELPRHLGLALIAVGTVGLAMAIWQYRLAIRYLNGPAFVAIAWQQDGLSKTPLIALAVTLDFIGVAAFVSVFTRLA